LQQAIDEDEQRTINEPIDDSISISQMQTEKSKKILNRFNYCEQGIQTYSSPKKDVITLADFIPYKKFVGLANQRIIYEEYAIDYAKQVWIIIFF
ncbi:unnamed protein product, partial [Adineta steineri]